MSEIIALSDAVSLALHGMGLLAAGERRNAREMAEEMKVSEAHLAKVFQRLVKSGLVLSTRGPGGGFELAGEAGKISLYHIYSVIEGDPSEKYCLLRKDECPFEECLFGSMLEKLSHDFVNYLKQTTLADLKRGAKA
ncbi:MAG: Rrf2 family transcriptional regulator [Synergistaceae bacterium]|nr:Rrf2 family transcriptional regulator [Synergistaceae bacterium]